MRVAMYALLARPVRTLLNQSHGGISMIRLVQDRANDRGKSIGLLLQGASAAALDLVSAMDNVTEELPNILLDRGLGPEAGVRGHLFANPAPDGLIRVEVR